MRSRFVVIIQSFNKGGYFARIENKHLTDEAEIEKAIKLGEYIRNGASTPLSTSYTRLTDKFSVIMAAWRAETIALYSLRKYRHLKRMYPEHSVTDPFTDPHPPAKPEKNKQASQS